MNLKKVGNLRIVVDDCITRLTDAREEQIRMRSSYVQGKFASDVKSSLRIVCSTNILFLCSPFLTIYIANIVVRMKTRLRSLICGLIDDIYPDHASFERDLDFSISTVARSVMTLSEHFIDAIKEVDDAAVRHDENLLSINAYLLLRVGFA